MKTMVRILLPIFACAALYPSVSACSPLGVGYSRVGQVLDWDTKRPVAGAVVVAVWEGRESTLVDSQWSCYHVETAVTERDGKFQLPTYLDKNVFASKKVVEITVFKAGHVDTTDRHSQSRGKERVGAYYVEKDSRPREQRFQYLRSLSGITQCAGAGDSRRNFYPFLMALYREALSLARTRGEREMAERYKEAAQAELKPYDPYD